MVTIIHVLTSPGWQAVTGSNLKSPDDGGSRGPGEVTRPVSVASRTGDQRDLTNGRLCVAGILYVETEKTRCRNWRGCMVKSVS